MVSLCSAWFKPGIGSQSKVLNAGNSQGFQPNLFTWLENKMALVH